MKRSYNVTGNDRKALVQVIVETLGIKPVYMKVPTCAYKIGNITVSRDGEMIWDGLTDNSTIRKIIDALSSAGYKAAEGDLPEPEDTEESTAEEGTEVTVSLPVGGHNGATLRNLVNLVFTRARLINRALGTDLSAEKGLCDALSKNEGISTAEDFLRVITGYEKENGTALSGIAFTPERITFSTLPENSAAEKIRAFTELVSMMNRQALNQKRIQAKAVNEENEKYALRIWLTRLGMNGPEFKETRRILMENLSGNAAFRTEADKQKWMERQGQKRRAAEEVTAE